MRPAITRAPGDAENNCPTYAFLSGDNSTPGELTTADERQGITIKEVGEEYLLSPVIAKKIVLALGVSKETINQIDVYDETDIENIFSVLLKHGRTHPLKTIQERAHFLPEHTEDILGGEVVKIDLNRPMAEIRAELTRHLVKTLCLLTGPMIVAPRERRRARFA